MSNVNWELISSNVNINNGKITIIEKALDTLAKDIEKTIIENGGYCPCSRYRTNDTKCHCKEFRELLIGECNCGLYRKRIDHLEKNNDS